jgi:hypothetical protein
VLVLGSQRLDLSEDIGDALIKLTPVFSQIGNEVNEAERQGVSGRVAGWPVAAQAGAERV